jgi:hypothetical protein
MKHELRHGCRRDASRDRRHEADSKSTEQPRVRRVLVGASILTILLAGSAIWLSTPRPAAAVTADRTAITAAPTRPLPIAWLRSYLSAHDVTTSTIAQSVTPPRPHLTTPNTQPPISHKTSPVHATAVAAVPSTATSGCAAAIVYLASHSAAGFMFRCPGYALGHQAMTCVNVTGVCPGRKEIVIAKACPASWMNEASNSWVLAGLSNRMIDPYGFCA